MSNTHLILHVKGTEQETTTLPKQVVRAAISQGQITHSQLIWSPEDNAWKQVRDLPHLLPSQKLAPAPTPRMATRALPKIEATPQPQAVAVPRVAVKVAAQTPRVKVKVAGAEAAAGRGYSEVESPRELNLFKWITIVLSVVILGTLGFNYVMVDQPLMSNLSKTGYSSVPVYAHLGAFVQTNQVLIHLPASPQVTKANLTDFLSTLARSTPRSPLSGDLYERVALTPGWTARYIFSGSDWQQLGEMQNVGEPERELFILEKITDAAGQPLISTHSSQDDDSQQAAHDKAWASIAAVFNAR